jgi:hypothetical protein
VVRLALAAIGVVRWQVLLNLPLCALKVLRSHIRTDVWAEDRPAEQGILSRDNEVNSHLQRQGQLVRISLRLSSRHGLQVTGKDLLGRSVTSLFTLLTPRQAGSSSPGTL